MRTTNKLFVLSGKTTLSRGVCTISFIMLSYDHNFCILCEIKMFKKKLLVMTPTNALYANFAICLLSKTEVMLPFYSGIIVVSFHVSSIGTKSCLEISICVLLSSIVMESTFLSYEYESNVLSGNSSYKYKKVPSK